MCILGLIMTLVGGINHWKKDSAYLASLTFNMSSQSTFQYHLKCTKKIGDHASIVSKAFQLLVSLDLKTSLQEVKNWIVRGSFRLIMRIVKHLKKQFQMKMCDVRSRGARLCCSRHAHHLQLLRLSPMYCFFPQLLHYVS